MNIAHQVPPLSQHTHIRNKNWKTKTCGIVGLCMISEYFDKKIPREQLLKLGLKLNFTYKNKEYSAYSPEFGWNNWGLVHLAEKFNFKGIVYDWSIDNDHCKKLNKKPAFQKLKNYLKKYPILASIYLNFNPKKGGHLVVITGISGTKISYNDPDSKIKKQIPKSVPIKKFLTGWKKRIIIIHP